MSAMTASAVNELVAETGCTTALGRSLLRVGASLTALRRMLVSGADLVAAIADDRVDAARRPMNVIEERMVLSIKYAARAR